MDPAIEHRDLRPPPEPRLSSWAITMAIMLNALLIAVVAWGIEWTRPARHDTPAASVGRSSSAQPSARRAAALQARTACPLRPLLVAAAGGKDGQVFPPANVDGKTEKDIDALLVVGKEAAAAGQVRDAEVDYLTSCRVADALKGAGSLASANARYQLARHYVMVADAASALPAAQRAVIYARAQAYYEDSLQRFRAEWGDAHERTRFAAQGLEAARAALAQTAQPPAARLPSVITARPSPGADAVITARMGAAPAAPAAARERQFAVRQPRKSVAAPQHAAVPKPSFDCRKARSYSERTICSDRELAQLDRDLGRLHARARQAAVNPAAFRQQNDAQWRRREASCRDRGCLLRWYAERRQQLIATLNQAQSERTASR